MSTECQGEGRKDWADAYRGTQTIDAQAIANGRALTIAGKPPARVLRKPRTRDHLNVCAHFISFSISSGKMDSKRSVPEVAGTPRSDRFISVAAAPGIERGSRGPTYR